jgi:hypothetical protein
MESETNQVGPITFSHPIARQQLLDAGVVLSFRSDERTTGTTWWRKDRLGQKVGDVKVTKEAEVDLRERPKQEMEHYRPLSGFRSVGSWLRAIRDYHGGDLPDSGYVYRVKKLTNDC